MRLRPTGARVAAACAFVLSACPAVHAQAIPGTFEAGVGLRRTGGMSLGGTDANETNREGAAFTLFTADSRLEGANGFEGRFGAGLSEVLRVEGSVSYGASMLSTRLSSDVEGIPDVTASESVQQYTFEGAVLLDLIRWRLGPRTVPFVSAGAGVTRYRHEGRTLVEDGAVFHLGGGANIVLSSRPQAAMKAFGVRADAQAVFRVRGIAFDDDPRTVPTFGLSAFVRF